jgi:predicted HicB family RNase H-like nuclease
MKPPIHTSRLNLRLPPRLHTRLDAQAKREETTINEYIRQAIAEKLDRANPRKSAMKGK